MSIKLVSKGELNQTLSCKQFNEIYFMNFNKKLKNI